MRLLMPLFVQALKSALGLTLIVALVSVNSNVNAAEVEIQTQVGLATAFERGGQVQLGELTIQPRVDAWLTDTVKLTGIGLVRADFADKLEPGRTSNATRSSPSSRLTFGDHVELELRELFVDFEIADTQLRIGKQQVVWGQADGLRILDVINPLNYREFILGDFEDRRIPLWMINAETDIGSARLQFLWIPDQTYDNFPQGQASYAFSSAALQPALEPGELAKAGSQSKPSRVLKDSDLGLRLSVFVGGWDLTANYLYHYQDQPVLELDRSDVITHVTPTYKRTHLVGGSASKAFGDFVLRSEVGFSTSRHFSSTLSNRGIEKTQELSGVVGLDYGGWTDTFVSGQIFAGTIDKKEGLVADSVTLNLSLLVQRTYLNDSVSIELLAIHNTKDKDGIIQFELSHQLSNNFIVSAGVDVFYGEALGLFGQFDQRDRLSLQVEWSP